MIRHRAQYSRGCRHYTCFCCCDTTQSSVFPGMSAPHLFLLLSYATELSFLGDVGTTPVFVVVVRHRAQYSRDDGTTHVFVVHTCFCCCDTPQSSVFPGMSTQHMFLLSTPVFVVVIWYRAQYSRGCRHHATFLFCIVLDCTHRPVHFARSFCVKRKYSMAYTTCITVYAIFYPSS